MTTTNNNMPTANELADSLAPEAAAKKENPMYTNADLRKAQESLSIVTSLLLTGLGKFEVGQYDKSKSFYAHFLNKMKIEWTNKLPTAGVSITDKINLYINPLFFNSLDPMQKIELIEHEIEHIIFLHPIRAKDYISTEKNAGGRFKCANISMDAYINENKPNLCKDLGVTYERLNKQLKEMGSIFRVSPNDPWEVNYEKLMQAAKDNPDKGEGGEGFGDPVDDHSQWGESTGQVSKEVAEGIVRDAANKAQAATGAGNMPSNMLGAISELNKSKVNWKTVFRRFVARALRFDFERTRNRRNRRYGLIQPGKRKKPQLSVFVLGDESGSMGDDQVAQAYAEIDAIAEQGIAVQYIAMDAEASEPIEYKKGMGLKRTRCGGTIYGSGIDLAKKYKPDLIIVIGDFDSADTPNNPGIPLLWVGVGTNQKPPADFGSVVYVNTTEK
jgi:predicted metal-dependent peptidase